MTLYNTIHMLLSDARSTGLSVPELLDKASSWYLPAAVVSDPRNKPAEINLITVLQTLNSSSEFVLIDDRWYLMHYVEDYLKASDYIVRRSCG